MFPRMLVAMVCTTATILTVFAQDPSAKTPRRYGLDADFDRFPQTTPQQAVASVVRAIDSKRFDYLLAHLSDPDYVDGVVRDYQTAFTKGKEAAKEFLAFDRLVREVGEYYLEDPSLIKDLRRFVPPREEDPKVKKEDDKDGKGKVPEPTVDWKMNGNQAAATIKGLVGRQVFFKKLGNRWYLENRQQ